MHLITSWLSFIVYSCLLSSTGTNCKRLSVAKTSDLKTKEMQEVADANSLFSASLQTTLRESSPSNLIFSPLSISSVIAMLKLGARGETSSEMVKAFNFPDDDRILQDGYFHLLAALKEPSEGYTLSVANKIYSKVGFELKEEYSQAVEKSFYSTIEQVNFVNSEAAAKTINTWVQDITRNRIQDIVTPDSLNEDTAMVLLNAVYFKGTWQHVFYSEETRKASFRLSSHDTVEVDMMQQETDLSIANLEDLNAQVLALPYQGYRMYMLIYLPNSVNGISQVEAGIRSVKLSELFGKMKDDLVKVHLPRFKIESSLNLVDPLTKLGVTTMFTEDANFTGISKTPVPLFVSDVIQKAFIEVNENGSEASASTQVTMQMLMYRVPISFVADHPFAFQIVDRHTNTVLFAGRCCNPTSNEKSVSCGAGGLQSQYQSSGMFGFQKLKLVFQYPNILTLSLMAYFFSLW